MGSKSAGPGGQMGGMGDVQPFDMPPTQQVPYNPYTMTTSADMNRQPPVDPYYGRASRDDFVDRNPPNYQPMGNVLGQVMGGGLGRMGGPPSPPQLSSMSNEDYLRRLYRAELGREPDQSGMDFWRQQMTNGMSRDQVRQMFDQSEEGQGYNQRRPQINGLFPGGPPTRVPVNGDGQPVRPPVMGPGMNPFMGNLGGDNFPMPQRAPIERPMLPPEVADALRLAMQGQTQRPMGQTPMGVMPMPQGRLRTQPFDPYSPAAQSEAAEIGRQMGLSPSDPRVQDELRLRRGLPVY